MRAVFVYELKKLFQNKLFLWLFAFLCLGAAILPAARIYLPDQDGKSKKALSCRYREYTQDSVQSACAAVGDRIQKLQWKTLAEQIDLYPEEYREIMWESLEEQSGLKREDLIPVLDEVTWDEDVTAQEEIVLLQEVQGYLQQIEGYDAFLSSVFTQEERLQSSLIAKEEAYAARLAHLTAAGYKKLQGISLSPVDPTGVSIALGEDTGVILVCCFSMLVCAFLFLYEKEQNVTALIDTTRNGRTATYRMKLLAAVSGSALYCLFVLLSQILWGAVCIGLGDPARPIQSIPEYITTAWRITVGETLLIHITVKMMVTVVVTLLFSAVCIGLNGAAAWCGMVGVLAVSVAANRLIPETSVFQPFRYGNLISFFRTDLFCRGGVYLKFGSVPVSYHLIFGLNVFLISVASIAAGAGMKNRGMHKRSFRKAGKAAGRRKRRIMPVSVLELKKVLIPQYGFFVVGITLLLQVVFGSSFYSRVGTAEQLYRNEVQRVQGPYSDDVDAMIQENYQEMLEREGLYQGVQLDSAKRLARLSEYLRSRSGTAPVQYFYETGYEVLLGLRDVGYRYQPLVIGLSLILILAGIFSLEAESGMEMLYRSTQGAETMEKRKIRLAFLLTVLIFLINWLPEIFFTFQNFPLHQPLIPAVSMQKLADAPVYLPVFGAVLWVVGVRLLGAAAVMLIVLSKSRRSRSYLSSVLKSMVIFGSQAALYVVLPKQWKMVSLYGMLAGEGACAFDLVCGCSVGMWMILSIFLYVRCIRQIEAKKIRAQ